MSASINALIMNTREILASILTEGQRKLVRGELDSWYLKMLFAKKITPAIITSKIALLMLSRFFDKTIKFRKHQRNFRFCLLSHSLSIIKTKLNKDKGPAKSALVWISKKSFFFFLTDRLPARNKNKNVFLETVSLPGMTQNNNNKILQWHHILSLQCTIKSLFVNGCILDFACQFKI